MISTLLIRDLRGFSSPFFPVGSATSLKANLFSKATRLIDSENSCIRKKFSTGTTTSLRKLTSDPESWKGASLLSVQQFTSGGLPLLFQIAQRMRDLVRSKGGGSRLENKMIGTVFFEASTRTCSSFHAAIQRLGGSFLHVDGHHWANSSVEKGETLEDTIKTIESYCDVTVLRHPVSGSVGKAIEVASKPVINAGDGENEHPTQALLDVFTIYDELHLSSNLENEPLVVVLLGDLKHSRTVHSLAALLSTCDDVWNGPLIIRYCAPSGLEMPKSLQQYINDQRGRKVTQESYNNLQSACDGAHVLYVTRIQEERFQSRDVYEEYVEQSNTYRVDKKFMNEVAPENMVILHPLPRVGEILPEVVLSTSTEWDVYSYGSLVIDSRRWRRKAATLVIEIIQQNNITFSSSLIETLVQLIMKQNHRNNSI